MLKKFKIAMFVMVSFLFFGSGAQAERICTWVDSSDVEDTTTYTGWVLDDGYFYNSWERVCTTTCTGPAVWQTVIPTRSCQGSVGVSLDTQGPGASAGVAYTITQTPVGPPKFGNGEQVKRRKQTECDWGIAEEPRHKAASNYAYLQHYTHEVLINSFVKSQVYMDGMFIPYGAVTDLATVAPGFHSMKIFPDPSLNLPYDHYIIDFDLIPSWTISAPVLSSNPAPVATVTFTNNSPWEVYIDITANPQQIGLGTTVLDNQRMIPAGDKTEISIEYYTEDGYVADYNQDLLAELIIREGDADGVPLIQETVVGNAGDGTNDNLAPKVTLHIPDGNVFTTKEELNINVEGTDDVAVASLELYFDGELAAMVNSDFMEHYRGDLTAGTHTVMAVARDGQNCITVSEKVTFEVISPEVEDRVGRLPQPLDP